MLPVSAMYRFPPPSTAIPPGLFSGLLVAGPGTGLASFPLPATIDSTPDGVTLATTFAYTSEI